LVLLRGITLTLICLCKRGIRSYVSNANGLVISTMTVFDAFG
jgi:hypothetical protein